MTNLALRSRVGVKVTSQGQISGAQQWILGVQLFRVQQRATIPITSLWSWCLCVSVIDGHMAIIAWMQLSGFLSIGW